MHAEHLKALENIMGLQDILFEDVAQSVPGEASTDSPSLRRRFVRSGFAMVEGLTAAWRRVALADAEAGAVQFNTGEAALIRGEAYDLDDAGRVRARPTFQPLARSVKFSFAILAKSYCIPFTLDVAGAGWGAFKRAIDVRNRLTHPKQVSDLQVSDDDIKDLDEAFSWFRSEAERQTRLIVDALHKRGEDEVEIVPS